MRHEENRPGPASPLHHRRLRILVALALAALLLAAAYRIIRLGLAENFARSDPELALQWSKDHPAALRARAEQLRLLSPRHSVQVQELLRKSLSRDPVDGRSFGLLGLEASVEGREVQASKLVDIGVRRAPHDVRLRVSAIQRGLRFNRLEDATRHIIAVMRIRNDRMHVYVEWLWYVYSGSKQGREAVTRVALEPGAWRQDLLGYIAAHAANPREILQIVSQLRERKIPVTSAEHDRILKELLGRRAWPTAFSLWAQDSSMRDVRAIPNVFNGDFSRELGARPGFDWENKNPVGALVSIDSSANRNPSLQVELMGHDGATPLVSHLLMVGPGNYRLQARVRSDGLRTDAAPVLSLSCVDLVASSPLVTIELGKEQGKWHERSTVVQIPEQNCGAQQIELRIASTGGRPMPAYGTFWVDDVRLTRQKLPQARDLQSEPAIQPKQ